MGQPLAMLLPERFRNIHGRHIGHFAHMPEVARRMGERRAIYGLHKDGHEFPAEASISKLALGDAHIFTVILRDITERKHVEEELEQRVQQRTAHLNTLLAVSRELFGARGLDAVLQRALSHALALVPEANSGAIYLVEAGDGQLALRASQGFSQMPQLSVPNDLGVLGRAFASQQMVVTSTVAEWQAHEPGDDARPSLLSALALTAAPSGALVLPLVAYDQVVGLLLLLRTARGGVFAADAYVTLTGLASLTAAAILEERSRQHTMTLSSQIAHLEEQHRTMAEQLNYCRGGDAAGGASGGGGPARRLDRPRDQQSALCRAQLPFPAWSRISRSRAPRFVTVSHDSPATNLAASPASSCACAISTARIAASWRPVTSTRCWKRRWRWPGLNMRIPGDPD